MTAVVVWVAAAVFFVACHRVRARWMEPDFWANQERNEGEL